MPIIGLTDRNMSFPEIGTIRKGAPKTANRPGKDLEYFRVDIDAKEVDAMSRFEDAYGSMPDEINILLPFDEIERFWDAWLEAYTAGRMVARSDGEFFTFLVDLETGEPIVKNGINLRTGKQEPHRDYIGKAGKSDITTKPTGRLKVIIPELRRLAYLTVKTTSFYDLINISEQLKAIKHISGGFLKGIPLVLRRRPKMISTPGDSGKRVRREKWLISIEADPSWVRPKFDEVLRLAMPDTTGLQTLPVRTPNGSGEVIELTPENDPPTPEDTVIEGEYVDEYASIKNPAGLAYSEIAQDQLPYVARNLRTAITKIGEPKDEAQLRELQLLNRKLDAANHYMVA